LVDFHEIQPEVRAIEGNFGALIFNLVASTIAPVNVEAWKLRHSCPTVETVLVQQWVPQLNPLFNRSNHCKSKVTLSRYRHTVANGERRYGSYSVLT
jgi:hypothetical protein